MYYTNNLCCYVSVTADWGFDNDTLGEISVSQCLLGPLRNTK